MVINHVNLDTPSDATNMVVNHVSLDTDSVPPVVPHSNAESGPFSESSSLDIQPQGSQTHP